MVLLRPAVRPSAVEQGGQGRQTKVSSFIRGLDRHTDLNPKVGRPANGVHHDAGAVRDLHEPIEQLSIQALCRDVQLDCTADHTLTR